MRNRLYFLIIVTALGFKCYGQDTTTPLHQWSIGAGINILIPCRAYTEALNWQNSEGDFTIGAYDVRSKISPANFFLNSSYSHNIKSFEKSQLSLVVDIGYQYHRIKSIKEGAQNSSWGGEFAGEITETSKNHHAFLDVGVRFSGKLTKQLYLVNQLNLGCFVFFNQSRSITRYDSQTGYLYPKSEYNEWLSEVGFEATYKLGLDYVMCRHVVLCPQVVVPLYVSKTRLVKERDWIKPAFLTPYFTSISNFSMINFCISVEYRF